MKYLFIFCAFFLMLSCGNNRQTEMIVKEWINKEIIFPPTISFGILGDETENVFMYNSDYKIIIYTDSLGCSSCKLQLSKWKMFMKEVDSFRPKSTNFLFFFFPKENDDIYRILLTEKFVYPVCLDTLDSFNTLNCLPKDERFQTFLLDKNNKVLAIGNPIHNPKVKELYMKIILGDKAPKKKDEIKTMAEMGTSFIDFGEFDWRVEQKATFKLKNTGAQPLVILDVTTSCGCISAQFPKEPLAAGKEAEIAVVYKADKPEHFNKTVTVYCNAENAPFTVKVTGTAK